MNDNDTKEYDLALYHLGRLQGLIKEDAKGSADYIHDFIEKQRASIGFLKNQLIAKNDYDNLILTADKQELVNRINVLDATVKENLTVQNPPNSTPLEPTEILEKVSDVISKEIGKDLLSYGAARALHAIEHPDGYPGRR